jgi:hypothetical protein
MPSNFILDYLSVSFYFAKIPAAMSESIDYPYFSELTCYLILLFNNLSLTLRTLKIILNAKSHPFTKILSQILTI